jgi:hypothetical protein
MVATMRAVPVVFGGMSSETDVSPPALALLLVTLPRSVVKLTTVSSAAAMFLASLTVTSSIDWLAQLTVDGEDANVIAAGGPGQLTGMAR